MRPNLRDATTDALNRLLGLQVDLAGFYDLASREARLYSLAGRLRGLKPPRYLTLFEALVNAIACQQITLTLGVRLLARLAESCGPSADEQGPCVHAFPEPVCLAGQRPEALRQLGFSQQKARALIELAAAAADGHLQAAEFAGMDDETVVTHLRQLRGVGRWTAEYVLLRGLGRLHVFPGDDVGARSNLRQWLHLEQRLDYNSVRKALTPWQAYAGLIYLYLLVDRLVEGGFIANGSNGQ